jgi:hypothetical protein
MRQGSLFADKLVVTDPGAAGFKIVSDLVIITPRGGATPLDRPAMSSRPIAADGSLARGNRRACSYPAKQPEPVNRSLGRAPGHRITPRPPNLPRPAIANAPHALA